MSLSKSRLAAAFKAAQLAAPNLNAVDGDALDELCDALADALIDEIKNNAVVTVASGIAVATTGTASAQTGATTATGTGTIA